MAPRGALKPKGSLVNGFDLVTNCHVFVSAPWSRREGEPYLIARVMEVLPPAKASTSSYTGPRVRLAYYLRPRDISNRYIADFRLLIATMHTDVVPGNYVRGLCTVRHKETIGNMEAYKRERDSFYWLQLYDRYLHRYFDAVSTDKVQNAPPHVLQHLISNFEYVLCEPSMANELSYPQRSCDTCLRWASIPESVECARCRKVFHLACLDPPLLQKPKTGYSWSCAPCGKAHDEEVEEYERTGIAPTRKPEPPAPRPSKKKPSKGKTKLSEPDEEVDPSMMRSFHGWPFRYFGMHTQADSVLDPHDSLYPRASTRLGNKFQAIVPDWDPTPCEEDDRETPLSNLSDSVKPSRSGTPLEKSDNPSAEPVILDRGEESAVQSLVQASEGLTDEKLDEFVDAIRQLPVYEVAGVDLIDRGLGLVHEGDTEKALDDTREVSSVEIGHAVWTEAELKLLSDGARAHGNDIEEIADEIPTKAIGDVVKKYYIDIGARIQEDVPQQVEEKVAAATRLARKGKAKSKNSIDDDEGSVCGVPTVAAHRKARVCAVCESKSSAKWYRCPEMMGKPTSSGDIHVMCEDCGLRWRHYGMQFPPTNPEDFKVVPPPKPTVTAASATKKPDKPEKPEKEKAESSVPKKKEATPKVLPPPPPPPPNPCVMCGKLDPKGTLAQCMDCKLSAHPGCISNPEFMGDNWRCECCATILRAVGQKPEVKCILCPPSSSDTDAKATPQSALDCYVGTEWGDLVHLICAVWTPEVRFDESPIVIAEGLSSIPLKRFQQVCCICNKGGKGATVKCEDCTKVFHVACAWSAEYRFAFELLPLKKKRPKDVVSIKFKDEDGVMTASIWCPDHHFSHLQRLTYELGEKDPRTKLTALEAYIAANRPLPGSDTFSILRRARRLDAIVESALKPIAPIDDPPLDQAQQVAQGAAEEGVDASVPAGTVPNVTVDDTADHNHPTTLDVANPSPPTSATFSSLSSLLNPSSTNSESMDSSHAFISPSPPAESFNFEEDKSVTLAALASPSLPHSVPPPQPILASLPSVRLSPDPVPGSNPSASLADTLIRDLPSRNLNLTNVAPHATPSSPSDSAIAASLPHADLDISPASNDPAERPNNSTFNPIDEVENAPMVVDESGDLSQDSPTPTFAETHQPAGSPLDMEETKEGLASAAKSSNSSSSRSRSDSEHSSTKENPRKRRKVSLANGDFTPTRVTRGTVALSPASEPPSSRSLVVSLKIPPRMLEEQRRLKAAAENIANASTPATNPLSGERRADVEDESSGGPSVQINTADNIKDFVPQKDDQVIFPPAPAQLNVYNSPSESYLSTFHSHLGRHDRGPTSAPFNKVSVSPWTYERASRTPSISAGTPPIFQHVASPFSDASLSPNTQRGSGPSKPSLSTLPLASGLVRAASPKRTGSPPGLSELQMDPSFDGFPGGGNRWDKSIPRYGLTEQTR
ncbi:hypothetical protein T439DRAFT_324248 [Meredithblackwellia eburnea MCA 4105]